MGERLTLHIGRHGGEPIAALLTLSFRDTLVYKYGGSDASRHPLGAMPFLFWQVIQEAKAAGATTLDLGRSDLDQPGLIAFKEHLGAVPAPMAYYEHPARRQGPTTPCVDGAPGRSGVLAAPRFGARSGRAIDLPTPWITSGIPVLNEPIPFLDLVTSHRELEEELVEAFREAVRGAAFVGGAQVEAFEQEFAAYCGAKYCVGVANGTDAVRLALMASGVGPGDAVVTVSHTFIATVEAISQAGADTEFVDIDERTYNMSPDALAAYLEGCATDPASGRPIGRRTGTPIKAVVPVHLYGQVADMDAILAIAARYDLLVIEDACQAHGAEYRSADGGWRRAGTFGTAAAFSFYPGKNLGACGEAGAVTTNDDQVAKTIKMLREHGQATKYYHDLEGSNSRLDAVQAAFLRVKLRHLDSWQRTAPRRRRSIHRAAVIDTEPDGAIRAGPQQARVSPLRDQARDARSARGAPEDAGHLLRTALSAAASPAEVLPRAGATRQAACQSPNRAAAEILSLPMFPGLTPRTAAASVRSDGGVRASEHRVSPVEAQHLPPRPLALPTNQPDFEPPRDQLSDASEPFRRMPPSTPLRVHGSDLPPCLHVLRERQPRPSLCPRPSLRTATMSR